MQAIPLSEIVGGRIPPERAVVIAGRTAQALDALHERGLAHGSIRPDTVLVGSDGTVTIDRSSLAAPEDESATSEADAVTPDVAAYISPEQAQGFEIDTRSDIYSLGVMLFEMLTGAVPFQGSSPTAAAYRHVSTPPARLDEVDPELPSHLADVVETALAKDPDDRYQSGEEMTEALSRTLGELGLARGSLEPVPAAATEQPSTARPRSPWSRLALASIIFLLAAVSAGMLPMLPASERLPEDPSTAGVGSAESDEARSAIEERSVMGEGDIWPRPWAGEVSSNRSDTSPATDAQPSPATDAQPSPATDAQPSPTTTPPPATTAPTSSPSTTSPPTTTATTTPTTTNEPTTTTTAPTTTTTTTPTITTPAPPITTPVP